MAPRPARTARAYGPTTAVCRLITPLTITDRGGNVANLAQTVEVLGASGQVVSGGGGSGGRGSSPGLHARLQLLPQGLRSVLRSGVVVRVNSNQSANGFATVSITRSAARRAHIKAGR